MTFAPVEQRRTIIAATNTVPLVIVKPNLYNVPAEDSFTLAVNRLKLIALNCKKPKELRVLNRVDGHFGDLAMGFSIRHLGFTSADSNQLFVAGEKTVSLVQVELNGLGAISFQRRDADVGEDVVATSASQNGVVALTSAGTLVEVGLEANITKKFGLKGPLGSSLLSVHRASGLAVVSGRSSGLDIVALTSEKSAMSKLWLPHGEDTPTAAYVLQGSKYGDALNIVTASQNNTELRFWTFVPSTSTLSLVQQLSLTGEVAADGAPAAPTPRLFVVSTNEEHILLPAANGSGIVVVELDRQAFKAARATDWVSPGTAAYLAAASFVRKTQDGTGVSFELNIVARSDERVVMLQFDPARLVGSSNLSPSTTSAPAAAVPVQDAAAAAAPSQKEANVSRWFGSLAVSALAAPAPTAAPTSVSSTISGRTGNTVDAAFVQAQAVSALRAQALAHRDSMAALDQQVIALQKQAGVVMKALQEQALKDDAVQVGRDFANRNKGRLTQQQQAAQPAPAANAALQNDVMQTLAKFTTAIPPAVNDASKLTVKDTLAKAIPAAVDKALAQIEKQDSDLSLPKMSGTESMQQFTNAVDKSNQAFNKLLKNETASLESMTVRIVTSSTERGKTVIQNSKAFLASLATELTGLRADIQDANTTLAAARSAAAVSAPVRDPSEVIKAAVSSAQAGRWAEAIIAVTNTGDIAVVMGFLQDKYIVANKDVLCDPATLPLPVLVTLLVSIASDIKAQSGNIPFRVGWLSDLLVEWDDRLRAMRTDPANSKLLSGCYDQFEVVNQNIAAIDKKTEVDRGTRFNIQLVTKLLREITGQ